MSQRLTILLPLKGRHLFTLRFLWFANQTKCPYHFVIADGQVHPLLAQLLEDSRSIFPNLDIDYVRYPEDINFARWYAKMYDALRRVRTPFVRLADNDDFLGFAGIERNLDFLDAEQDYVCSGGGVAGFSVYSSLHDPNGGLVGPFNRLSYRYTAYDRSVSFSSYSVVERLRQGSRYWWPYYAVYRADALRTIWREVVELDFSDLQIHELFCLMRTLTLGKAHADGAAISYLRQYGTPRLTPAFSKDWVHHLLRSRFTGDFAAMIERISTAAATADGVDRSEVADVLHAICERWLREFLRANYGELQGLKQWLRDNAPSLVLWLKRRRRYFVGRERSALISQLARDGASPQYRQAFARELQAVDHVLTGFGFDEFIRPYVPVLNDLAMAMPTPPLPQAAE